MWLCGTLMTTTNSLLTLPRELLLRKTICAMWQKLFQVLCLYVLVVFKMFPSRTTWHWVFLRQVTYLPDWESSLLLWNLRICHYDENVYRFTTYLVSFHSFWWLLPLQNGLLICQMIQWPSMDKPFMRLHTIFSVISHTADE